MSTFTFLALQAKQLADGRRPMTMNPTGNLDSNDTGCGKPPFPNNLPRSLVSFSAPAQRIAEVVGRCRHKTHSKEEKRLGDLFGAAPFKRLSGYSTQSKQLILPSKERGKGRVKKMSDSGGSLRKKKGRRLKSLCLAREATVREATAIAMEPSWIAFRPGRVGVLLHTTPTREAGIRVSESL